MRKKFLILGLAVAMALGATACSGKNTANDTTAAKTEAAKDSSEEALESAVTSVSQDKEAAKDSNKFPEFKAKTVDGEDITSDVFKNSRLTVVNIGGSWCGPCVQEIPELQKLYENMKDQGVNVIGIAQDSTTDMDAVKEIIEQDKVTYQNIVPEDSIMDLILGVQAFPTTLFVDGEGNVVGRIEGRRNLEAFTQTVEEILAKM